MLSFFQTNLTNTVTPTVNPGGLCIKVGRGHRDACVGTWDLGTRDEGLGDVKYGTWGRQKLGRREPGMFMIIAKVGGKCDISFFVKMCYLWSTLDSIFQNHIGHLMMFTQNTSLYNRSKSTDYHDWGVRVDFHCRVILPCIRV